MKILVANRGEIAVRVIRACRDLGLPAAVVYADPDEGGLAVQMADEKVRLPGWRAQDTYLNAELILRAARETGCRAVHPGYGYLAENERFALACRERGLQFIGPRPENIRLAGLKLAAREKAREAGVSVLPGTPNGVGSREEAGAAAAGIGYPVMLKAGAGGGGRGMRVCRDAGELAAEFAVARGEARAAFGDDTVYVEKYLPAARHVEFQILGDHLGRVIHLGERECTLQRRYQKLVEESPSPALDETLRAAMGRAAVKLAEYTGYFNAGTVEFLLDEEKNFYFLEINARIQVEHPVTEMVTGIDLVREQIRLCLGEEVPSGWSPPPGRHWALECRINAEDPENAFSPSPGRIDCYRPPGGWGVRLDTHIHQGYVVPPCYDSLLAKLITAGRDRPEAVAVMRRALAEFVIAPVKTTIPWHQRLLADPSFIRGNYDSGFMRRFWPQDEEED